MDHMHHGSPMSHNDHHNHHHQHENNDINEDYLQDYTGYAEEESQPLANGHDHNLHGHMTMYFHGGFNEVILFDFWRISSLGGLIGSMVGCFLLAVFYEGLKYLRESLLRKNFRKVNSNSGQNTSTRGQGTFEATGIFTKAHFFLTLLHMIQLTIAYFLMLIFMTYNSWLCLAVILGATVGYFTFGWRRTLVLEEDDHCH